MRGGWAVTIPGNGLWPDQQGGRETAPFKWIRFDHRTLTATQPVIVCLDGPPAAAIDDDRSWEVLQPGERRIRNVGGIKDPAADDLHLLNLDANPVVMYVEISDTPIVDIASFPGRDPQAVLDIGVFFTETTAPLIANATFTGPWHDALNFNWFGAYAVADQTFTLAIDEADAATPNVINQVATQASAAAPAANNPGGQFARIVPTKTILRFIRVRVVNGPTAEGRLNVQSSLSPLN